MARVTAATAQNVQLQASQAEIRAIGASGIDVQVQGSTVLLSQGQFAQLFGRLASVGQSFDVSSQRFIEPEPEPTPVSVERPVERPSVFEETFQQRVERAKKEAVIKEQRRVSPVSIIPESVRRGERQLPAFDVVSADTGLPIPRGEGVELDFVRRPPPLRKPSRQETAEFAPREAVLLEKQAQQFEVQQIVSELPERLRTGILGGFEQVRGGRPPTGPEMFIESAAVGAVTAIPALPATVFSIVSDPIGTGKALVERAITKPIEFAGETAGGLLVFGGISKGLGRLKAPKPTLSLDIGKSVQFGMGGKPATFTVTKGLIRVGKKEFGAVGRTLTFETGAVSEFIGLGEAAVFKLKKPPKTPDIINIAVAGKETFVSGQTRAGFFIGAFKGQKVKDLFVGKFVSKKQADVTQTLTGTLTKKGQPGLGLSLIEDLKITPKPSRLPGGFAPTLKPPKQVSASLRKAFLEAPSVKRAARIEQIKTVVPEAARITGLSMRGFKQTPAARARSELFITPRQIPKQKTGLKPISLTAQKRASATATKTRQKLTEELTSQQGLKQPSMTEQARSFRQLFGQTQVQAQAQRQALRQRSALRQRAVRRTARVSFAAPAALRFGFGLPRIPQGEPRFGFGRGESRQFRFREIINPLGTAEQILGLPKKSKKRRRKKK